MRNKAQHGAQAGTEVWSSARRRHTRSVCTCCLRINSCTLRVQLHPPSRLASITRPAALWKLPPCIPVLVKRFNKRRQAADGAQQAAAAGGRAAPVKAAPKRCGGAAYGCQRHCCRCNCCGCWFYWRRRITALSFRPRTATMRMHTQPLAACQPASVLLGSISARMTSNVSSWASDTLASGARWQPAAAATSSAGLQCRDVRCQLLHGASFGEGVQRVVHAKTRRQHRVKRIMCDTW